MIPDERIESINDIQRFNSTLSNGITFKHNDWIAKSVYWIRSSWDAANHQWNQWIIGYNSERQKKFLGDLGLHSFSLQQLVIIMLGFSFFIFSGVMFYVLYQSNRHSDPIVECYRRFCTKLARVGVKFQPWQGSQAY